MNKILFSIFFFTIMLPALALAEQRCKTSVMHLSELQGCLRPLADGTGTRAVGSVGYGTTAMDQLPTVIPTSWMVNSYRPYIYAYGTPYGNGSLALYFAITQGIR